MHMNGNLTFDDGGEAAFYAVLLETQEHLRLQDGETFGILCQPTMRVAGHAWRPDFLITYRGRCAVVEVDGWSHRKTGRYASDRSRQYILEDHGVHYVAQVCVEDASDPDRARAFIDRVLRRLDKAAA
jgi:hypothetical protein